MLPVIALVGRPNVGKSTLFNQLTKSRDALVANLSGLTRDRQYGEGRCEEQRFIVIDTGGITGEEAGIDAAMAAHCRGVQDAFFGAARPLLDEARREALRTSFSEALPLGTAFEALFTAEERRDYALASVSRQSSPKAWSR